MLLGKLTPAQMFDIKQPRWKDKTVLLAKHKVGTHNSIVFSETKSMPGTYYVSGEETRRHPVQSNGSIDCYAVPLSILEPLERFESEKNDD